MPKAGPARALIAQDIIDEISQLRRGHRLGLRVALIQPNGMILRFDAQDRDQRGLTVAHTLRGEDTIR